MHNRPSHTVAIKPSALATYGSEVFFGLSSNSVPMQNCDTLIAWSPADGAYCLPNLGHLSGGVLALTVVGDTLWIGGSFSTPYAFLVRYDLASRQPIEVAPSTSLTGPVEAIAVDPIDPDYLYIAGSFFSVGPVGVQNFARLYLGNNTWEALLPGIDEGGVRDMVVAGGYVFVGGTFTNVQGDPDVDYLVAYSLDQRALVALNRSAAVYELATNGDLLVVAGDEVRLVPMLAWCVCTGSYNCFALLRKSKLKPLFLHPFILI